MDDELRWRNYPLEVLPGNITGGFGANYGGYKHRGTDVGVPIGTPVVAPANGLAVAFTNDGSYGNAVCLRHPGTNPIWYSLYAHLDSVDVYTGQDVKAGQRIGLSGNTGMSTGPHLHWQVCLSPSFPTDIRFSRDAMLVPFEEDDDEMMTEDERTLLLLVASVVGGWSTGQHFVSVEEALPSFRTFEGGDQRVLIGMGLTSDALDKTIKALTAHINAHPGESAPEVDEALVAAEEALFAVRSMGIAFPEEREL